MHLYMTEKYKIRTPYYKHKCSGYFPKIKHKKRKKKIFFKIIYQINPIFVLNDVIFSKKVKTICFRSQPLLNKMKLED